MFAQLMINTTPLCSQLNPERKRETTVLGGEAGESQSICLLFGVHIKHFNLVI